ncbi:MAG: hypothetical protein ACO3K7_06330 [Candidatus Marinamargulisbacteria bacterium]
MLVKKTSHHFNKLASFSETSLLTTKTIHIDASDVSLCLNAIDALNEYIRFCCIPGYVHRNKSRLSTYCRLLLNYERCNQASLIRSVRSCCHTLLHEAVITPGLSSLDLCIELMKSHYLDTYELANECMNYILGTHVRGVSF